MIIRFVQLILRWVILYEKFVWYILSKDLDKATVDVSVNLYSVVVSLPGISHCLVWFLPKIIELLIELKLIVNLIEKNWEVNLI